MMFLISEKNNQGHELTSVGRTTNGGEEKIENHVFPPQI